MFRDTIWTWIGGPADQGYVDIFNYERRSSPNEALFCPPDMCGERADMEVPYWPLAADRMFDVVSLLVLRHPRVEIVDLDRDNLRMRVIQRSKLMRYPDTIQINFMLDKDGYGTFAMLSRSLIGYSDLGANRARLLAWMDAFHAELNSLCLVDPDEMLENSPALQDTGQKS